MNLSLMLFILLVVLATVAVGGLLYLVRRSKQNPKPDLKPDPKPIPNSRKIIEISIGFVAWYVINGLIWIQVAQGPYAMVNAIILLPGNIVVLLICAIIPRLRRVALGILIALALNFVISLLLGLLFNALCFIPFFDK